MVQGFRGRRRQLQFQLDDPSGFRKRRGKGLHQVGSGLEGGDAIPGLDVAASLCEAQCCIPWEGHDVGVRENDKPQMTCIDDVVTVRRCDFFHTQRNQPGGRQSEPVPKSTGDGGQRQ